MSPVEAALVVASAIAGFGLGLALGLAIHHARLVEAVRFLRDLLTELTLERDRAAALREELERGDVRDDGDPPPR